MEKKQQKNAFIQGSISPAFIEESIAKHQTKTHIGAHNIFLGQVRADTIDGKTVSAIEYTAYEDMANKKFNDIRQAAFERFDLACLHIHHSLGLVKAGKVCLFISVSAPARKTLFNALAYIVEAIKKDIPIFGKEHLEDASHRWKTNR